MSVAIATVAVNGTVELTAGDDPDAIGITKSGMVRGTFTFSNISGSGSVSFMSPYCKFYGCP
jgi:hypothetical protein